MRITFKYPGERCGGTNLLAGRAVQRFLFPFVHAEIPDSFDLEAALRFGTLPAIHGLPQVDQIDILGTFANTHLREEIQQEGLVRNLGGFSRFLDLAAAQSGELVNFSAFGRECGLPTRTVQSYCDILEETLIGHRLEPWTLSARKRLVAHQKFYLFDTGVTNAGAGVDLLIERNGRLRGAFQMKASRRIAGANLSGLRAFHADHPKVPLTIICDAAEPQELDEVHVLPWRLYFQELAEILG